MPIIKTSSKGQLVIPVDLRTKYGLKPGTYAYIDGKGKSLIITPVSSHPIDAACGILKNSKSISGRLIKERKKELRHEKKKHNR